MNLNYDSSLFVLGNLIMRMKLLEKLLLVLFVSFFTFFWSKYLPMGARFALIPISAKRELGEGRAHWEEGVRAFFPTKE